MRKLVLDVRVLLALGLLLVSACQAPVEGDAAKGKAAFAAKCALCHQVGEGAKPLIGPPLNGIVGQKAGAFPGFAYTPGFKETFAETTWSDENLDPWIADPKALVPTSPMAVAFTGIPEAGERVDIIAYLKTIPK
jgi:cytochrome c